MRSSCGCNIYDNVIIHYSGKYRVYSQLLRITVWLNTSYYGNEQFHSNSSQADRLDICECELVHLHLKDLTYCPNSTHFTEQSFSVAGFLPCTSPNA